MKHNQLKQEGGSKHFGHRQKEDKLHQGENNRYQDSENIFGCQYCIMSRLTWTGLMEHIKMMHQALTDQNVLDKLTEDFERIPRS